MKIFSMDIPLFPNEKLINEGITKYIYWDYQKVAHAIIFGSTGSGKTYALKIALGRISKHVSDSEIILCDYKSDLDFEFASGYMNFYRFTECIHGLNYTTQILQERQSGVRKDRHLVIFVFDEWASFISNIPTKKEAEQAKSDLSSLLMLGRSFNIQVIISQQRVDSVFFNAGGRDNFSLVIGLGSLSKESINMMYANYKQDINPNKPRGHGTLINGNKLHDIVVPYISNIDRLHSVILMAVNRYH